VQWRRPDRATLDDVVELLEGLGRILMGISAKLEEILDLIERDGDDEPEP
jgi:hypothetical protein